ncbi:MAG TPA: SRPBCC family protein [Terrimicrobiaceae bacterium]
MIIKILIGVAAILAVLLTVVAMQPGTFRIERTATLGAPVGTVFAQVNDLHKWEAWSPWAKLDPTAKNTFEGPPTGVGAAFVWSGNNQIGEGRMTITDSRSNELVRFRLDFLRPFKATNTAEFAFKPEGDKTVVTWSMSGTNNLVGKAMSLIMNCDKMLGGFFEQGLAQLDSVAKTAATN